MPTLEHPSASFRDYSVSAASTRVAIDQYSRGPGLERSDPHTEWAIRFDQGLKRAEERIRAWSRDAGALADEDLQAPSRDAMDRAIEVINLLKVLAMDRVPPAQTTLLNLRGVSLGSGGEISLELGAGPLAVTYRVESDGAVTELHFMNNRLIRRDQIPR